MNLSKQIAKRFRELHFGGSPTSASLKENIADISWEEATTQVYSLNTIAKLVFHVNYYVGGVLKVLEGGTLDIRDKYSYDLPTITCQEDWERLCSKALAEAEMFAEQLEKMPEEKLYEAFVDEKYGNYFNNMLGIIEHTYYHLGQIAIIKKIVKGKQ